MTSGLATRKHVKGNLAIWRLAGRPARHGIHFEARPHWVIAPASWDEAAVVKSGAVYLSESDALIALGELAVLRQLAVTGGVFGGLPETPAMTFQRKVSWSQGVFDVEATR